MIFMLQPYSISIYGFVKIFHLNILTVKNFTFLDLKKRKDMNQEDG